MNKKTIIGFICIILLLCGSNLVIYRKMNAIESEKQGEIDQLKGTIDQLNGTIDHLSGTIDYLNGAIEPLKEKVEKNYDSGWNTAEIVLPSKLVYCPEKTLDIYYDNVILGMKADLANDCYMDSWEFKSMKRFARMDLNYCKWIDTNMVVNIGKNQNLSKSFTLAMVDKEKQVNDGKRILFIGDSITQDARYVHEVYNLFRRENVSINLLGTRGNGYVHEGREGWSAYNYCHDKTYLDMENAFYNENADEDSYFDFTYYMTNNHYEGVDDVFINLGINDVNGYDNSETLKCYANMITSIKEYDPEIKIFVGLCILPAEYSYGTGNTANEQNKFNRLELIKELIEIYDDSEDEGIFVVPYYICIDTENDWDKEEQPLSSRNNDLVDYVTDEYSTHPGQSGHNKLADMTYTYIRYAEDMKER